MRTTIVPFSEVAPRAAFGKKEMHDKENREVKSLLLLRRSQINLCVLESRERIE